MELLDGMIAEYSTLPRTPPPAQPARNHVPPVRGSRSRAPAATPPPGRVPSDRPGRRLPEPYYIPEAVVQPTNVPAEPKDEAEEFFGQPTVEHVEPVDYHFGERAAKRLSYFADLAIDVLSAPGTFIPCQILCVATDTILCSDNNPSPVPIPPH